MFVGGCGVAGELERSADDPFGVPDRVLGLLEELLGVKFLEQAGTARVGGMKREAEMRIVRELLRQLDENVNIDAGVQMVNPTSSYTCVDQAQREWDELFRGHPQLIGLSSDLPDPHSYLTIDDFGIPVLATRDGQGRFRAFLNACRHRGVRLAHDVRGSTRRHTCVFHNWSYDTGGALVGIPREHDFGEVDRSCNGLVELPAEERHGMLWVHPRPEGVLDLDELLGGLDEELAEWNLGDFVYLGESVIEKDLNWKLANDTFGETYHFERLHQKTLGQLFHGDALHYETFGRNHRFCFASRLIDQMRTLPEDEWGIRGNVNVLYYLFPNIQLNVGGSVSLIRIYPDPANPGTSITKIGHYFSPADIEAAAAAEVIDLDQVYTFGEERRALSLAASMEVFDSTVEQEDYLMGETTQKAAESGLLDRVIFGRNEPALHHYHNTFRAALGQPPLEVLDAAT